ncbi:hypothetical protein AB0K48_61355, partial [Nonomuraea sp. NPDC055795]
ATAPPSGAGRSSWRRPRRPPSRPSSPSGWPRWGLAYGAVPVCSQAWFARAAPDAPEAATVVFTSSFQATFALGALSGGLVVDTLGVGAVMLCAGVTALAMAASLWTLTR